ncbi:hypothetical protein KR222_008690 [Zaprionus bogoriensis]|nr:hypothetical protein KR222_008690 [Zaprionus bogoriensis]
MDISAYQHMNIRMSTRGKRPLRNLTPNDKVRAIQRIHNGETKASVSRDIGVPESTLRGWCKNEQKLRFMCRQLGSDNLGLGSLDTPPEKRAKFELQLLPPKFATMPSYDELGFGSFPIPPMDYASHNEALLEKFALVDFIKRSGLHKESMQPLPDLRSANTDSVSAISGYSTNNMVHQLNLLALFNSKLSPKVDHGTAIPTAAEGSPKVDDSPPQTTPADESKKYNCPLLSVKNWAKDPAKQVPLTETQYANDSNNNDVDAAITTSSPDGSQGQSTQIPAEVSLLSPPTFDTRLAQPPIDVDGQGGALLDWCKMFSASLNFFAFAAAAASIQPGNGPAAAAAGLQTPSNATEDTQNFNHALLKRLSPLVHSESSEESYYDSEPEDLSVRSCASKVSSSINSRSQSPDKNSTSSTSVHSDGEQ